MAKTRNIPQLIINSPYEEPGSYWSYERETRLFDRKDGRQPAGYVVATPDSQAFDDPGVFVEIPLVNQIRPRVKAWREGGYAGVTGITKRLLEHWRDSDERQDRRFFFCQLEAIETLIWLAEASAAERQGIDIPGDGGAFQRLCAKMATGSGKTIVMAMVIAWQVLNKVTYSQDKRFSKHVFVVAPGLTVKSRLQVLIPDNPDGSYYDEFNIIPPALNEKLRLGKVMVRNWHVLNWETDEQLAKKRSVDKRGAKSDEAYVRDVLGEMANARNLVVLNDEAHHAWRMPADGEIEGVKKEDIDEATKWVGGLDRIHAARGILNCFDFSATPFVPSGRRASEEALFGWIVSDFGLNDAIESGLVKTPRVVVRDDALPNAQTYKSRLYHIYMDRDVKDDVNRKAEPEEPLPDLVINGYFLLGADWRETAKAWRNQGHRVPPVMISVANRTETAARIKYAFDHGRVLIDELVKPELTLHIDSKTLDMAEAQDEALAISGNGPSSDDENDDKPAKKLTKQQQAERLRQMVDTVGQPGKPGEKIQNVISVGMLSEGWDAKTVTHIMGLRAFTSQLLCEQVVGRGLRRTSYDVNPDSGLFESEYVNIFGVPFTFMPHEGGEDGPAPPPPSPKTRIEPLPNKRDFEISWPNVVRIDRVFKLRLSLNLEQVRPLELNAAGIPMIAQLAPVIEGKPDITRVAEIDLEELGRQHRMQRIMLEAARDVYDQMKSQWPGSGENLLSQLFGLAEKVIASDRIRISPSLFNQDDLRRRIVLTLSMTKIVQHIKNAIHHENTEALEPIFDAERPIRRTGDMRPWYTGKPCEIATRSHISHCVYDGTWEASEAFELDRNEHVGAWVKNDHLGFEIVYTFGGAVRKYWPDFLIRLTNGTMLVLEVKGQDDQQNRTKREFLAEWVQAVNQHAGFGRWACDVSKAPSDVADILMRH